LRALAAAEDEEALRPAPGSVRPRLEPGPERNPVDARLRRTKVATRLGPRDVGALRERREQAVREPERAVRLEDREGYALRDARERGGTGCVPADAEDRRRAQPLDDPARLP